MKPITLYGAIQRLGLISISLISGCTFLLPAHTNSNKRTSEKVSITPVTCTEVKADKPSEEASKFLDNYKKAYDTSDLEESCRPRFIQTKALGECNSKVVHENSGAAPVAIIASAAVGLATDYIKSKLEEEKSLYTAQYVGRRTDDKFWKSVKHTTRGGQACTMPNGTTGRYIVEGYELEPNYIGLKLMREVEDKNMAMNIFYGFRLSNDRHFIQIKPISFVMPYAKAKVLSNEWGTWVFPLTLLVKPFKISNNSVDIQLDFSMDSYVAEPFKDYAGPKTIAAFRTNISGYDLNNPKTLGPADLENDSGWSIAPPISDTIDGYPNGFGGNFFVKIKATEKDTSEATKILEVSEEWASKGGQKLQDNILGDDK
jgi:hypothetical protein